MTKKRIKELIAEKERHWKRCSDRNCPRLADKLACQIEELHKLLNQ